MRVTPPRTVCVISRSTRSLPPKATPAALQTAERPSARPRRGIGVKFQMPIGDVRAVLPVTIHVSRGGFGPPSRRVIQPRCCRVWNWADDRTDLELAVALDGGLARSAVGLSPDNRHLGSSLHLGVEGGQRQRAPLVGAVTENIDKPMTLPS